MSANQPNDADRIIDAMGGTNAVAKFFEIEPASVSGWRKSGIPAARLRHLRDVRPDLFVAPAAAPSAEPLTATAAG